MVTCQRCGRQRLLSPCADCQQDLRDEADAAALEAAGRRKAARSVRNKMAWRHRKGG